MVVVGSGPAGVGGGLVAIDDVAVDFDASCGRAEEYAYEGDYEEVAPPELPEEASYGPSRLV